MADPEVRDKLVAQGLTGGGQRHGLGLAVKQLCTDGALQCRDVVRHTRGRAIEPRRSPDHRPGFLQRDKDAQPPQGQLGRGGFGVIGHQGRNASITLTSASEIPGSDKA